MLSHNKNQIIRKAMPVALSLALLMPIGCSKSFLEVPPQAQQPSEQFFVDQEDALQATYAMYANLRTFGNVAFGAFAIESMGSDDAEKGSSPGDASFFNTYDNFSHTASEGQTQGFWAAQYSNVNLANQILDNVGGIAMDEGLKNRILAEAKFIRAYSYFRLVRAFGGVPLLLTVPLNAEEYLVPRSTAAEVWATIEKDLTEAATVLPANVSNAELGRATRGAALALHAKASMYQSKWSQVSALTDQVISLGYDLFPSFEGLFRIPNENNRESIFEIQATYVPGNCDVSNSQYSQTQGVRGSRGGGWGFNVPTAELASAFEADDPRRDATIIFRGETTPQGDLIPATGDNPRYNQKSYVPFSQYVECNEGSEQNIRVIRFADVLLMKAEAANELGNTTAALEALNRVRRRARGSNPSVLPDVTTTNKDALRLAIWNERHYELAMEGDRFFDVIRQGRAPQIFGPKGFKAGKNEVFPIPQTEIDISGGILTQNPGY
ncbi:RagB/SusD family nutrient uptake outer membrane protein [Flavitalea sp.]|nr:RagB/SusD family nutrient uptake outer membrane protein [Flavitalea sp.]